MMSYHTKKRFAFIETYLYWGGGVTAPQLAEAFNIDRRNAQNVIAKYREQYPDQLIYNDSTKRHEPSLLFQPEIISTNPHLYLDYLRGSNLVGKFIDHASWTDLAVVNVDELFRTAIDNQMVKKIINAVQFKQALSIEYHSKSQWYSITVSPHHIVYASRRYHVRAYVHEWDNYIDMVLSRVYAAYPSPHAWISDESDKQWQQLVELKFKPNPELPEQLRKTLQIDYYDFANSQSLLKDGVLIIKTRKALEAYVLREMERIDWKYKIKIWIVLEV